MRTTTIATIEAHSTSRYGVLMCLGGGAILSLNTAHLTVPGLARELSDVNAFLFTPVCPLTDRQ